MEKLSVLGDHVHNIGGTMAYEVRKYGNVIMDEIWLLKLHEID